MTKCTILAWLCCFSFLGLQAQEKSLRSGMVISRSTKIKKAVYRLDAPADTARPLIVIRGNNLVIDFNNAELLGSAGHVAPDEFFGVAILIENSSRITIRNLKAGHYKVALIARQVDHLTVEHCDFSYNYRQHLNSTPEKEDLSDWMSYHHNEHNEWLRYGAALYLQHCNNATVSDCIVTGGQNGLMMTDCNKGRIFNNNFSFNSGIGLGLYRCSDNIVAFNKLDFNVRGYSHGVYNRGQDSAGILVYEQSNRNQFIKNSVTHSGDGFFLWAGQTTMDSGAGGCNDNRLVGNDFSFAPTNGVEATFSRVTVINNRIFECDHGIWGGYSYDAVFSENQFRDNRIGIAIEHGQHNVISNNLFSKDKTAIKLWANPIQDPSWGYPRYHDTRSADYVLYQNSFNSNGLVLDASATDSLQVYENTYSNYDQLFRLDSSTRIDSSAFLLADTTTRGVDLSFIAHPADPFKGNGKLAGRKNILITEWGPYDFRSPVIWRTNPTDTGELLHFSLLGPEGKWRVLSAKGVDSLSVRTGSFPATLVAHRAKGARTDIDIRLEFTGQTITTPFGEPVPAGKGYPFSYRQFFQPINWQVLFYSIDTNYNNPIKTNMLFLPTERKAPVKTDSVTELNYAWWGGLEAGGLRYRQFVTLAEGQAEFPEGEYELSVTWDDAVRVYVDEKRVVDEWDPLKYDFDESPHKKIRLHLGGLHHFRVEHVELGGFATLSLKIKPID